MFGATFNLVTRVEYRNFGTQKDGSLQINSLASNNVSVTEVFQNSVNTLSKMINYAIFVKGLIFFLVRQERFCSNFTSKWSKYLSNNVLRNFNFSM